MKEKLLEDFAHLFAMVERGSPKGPDLIRQLAARHQLKEPVIEAPAATEEISGDNPS